MIEVKDMTLKYPNGRGVFDLNFSVKEGQIMGYLGPNGAGKTTTIRALLGFMKPNSGYCTIGGLDCTKMAPEIQKNLGYIPGEISFFENMSGNEFLNFINDMRGSKDLTRQNELIDMFELNPKGKIKKFSKGMKQKLGIVAAFMHDPQVLILDEPTSGLDPLMQNRFVQLILTEKAKNKTILLSSHIFEEVEKTCDNVIIIKDGRIVEESDIPTLKYSQRKGFVIRCSNREVIKRLEDRGFEVTEGIGDEIEVSVKGKDIDTFIKTVAEFKIDNIDVKTQSLEDIFMHYYGKEED